MKIAIIGSGISGLGAAYLLSPHHNICLYEKNAYLGGHSRTITVQTKRERIPVDTGFIVFNNWNYPNLLKLFNRLQVPYVKSRMSFGVSINESWLEYSSSELFAPRNLVRPAYLGMLRDVLRFNRAAPAYIQRDPSVTLGQCLEELNMGEWFKHYYLLAMGAAIWSCPLDTILLFPARTFLQFFKNHGLLSVNKRPQWYTVQGGSRQYVKRLSESFAESVRLNCAAVEVWRDAHGIHIRDSVGETRRYDQVVFACHGDEALNVLADPPEEVSQVLSSFSYQNNHIVVHSDISFLPRSKKSWTSWVYLSEAKRDHNPAVSLSYWMNNLQPLKTDTPIIVTLNPGRAPAAALTYDHHTFSHPIFDLNAIEAQSRIDALQGKYGLWFCGAYQRYGFHEDGLHSTVNMVSKMGVDVPWT